AGRRAVATAHRRPEGLRVRPLHGRRRRRRRRLGARDLPVLTRPPRRGPGGLGGRGRIMPMLRWLTAGESHRPALVAVLEGLPAGVQVTSKEIQASLARRRLGYGRGARMAFEQDELEIVGGLRHGLTMGSPIALRIGNSEWPKWEQVMAADPVDEEIL